MPENQSNTPVAVWKILGNFAFFVVFAGTIGAFVWSALHLCAVLFELNIPVVSGESFLLLMLSIGMGVRFAQHVWG